MRRFFLIFALLLFASLTVPATEIVISGFQTPTQYRYPDGAFTLRLYSSDTFTTSDGKTVVANNPGGSWYFSTTCTASANVLTCQSFTLSSTVDSSRPSAGYTGILYDSRGNQRETLFSKWRLDKTPTSITYKDWETYNLAKPVPLGDSYYTKAQIDSKLAGLGIAPLATDGLAGRARLNIPAANLSDPVVLAANDPRILEEISLSRYATLGSAASAAGTTKQLVIDKATAPSANLDLSNVVLRFANGGAINPTAGVTVTLGVITAPRVQIFGGAGSAVFSKVVTVLPEWFGVKMDAQLSTDGVTTASSTTFTSASRACTSADAGKSIIIYGAGGPSATTGLNNALRTTISGCSGNNFVLASSASAATTNTRFVYGATNTSAMQKAANSLSVGGTLHLTGSAMMGGVALLSNTTLYTPPNSGTLYATSNSMFTFSNTSNVTVDGVKIDAGGFAVGGGNMTVLGGTTLSNVLIQNCYLTDTFLTNNLAPVQTFSRQGILLRDYDGAEVAHCRFYNGMRIKAHGSGASVNGDFHDNYFGNMNENGFSLLDGSYTGIARNIKFHDNIMEGVMATGNLVTIGDDGNQVVVGSATNANPAVFTSSLPHGLTSGWLMYFSGGTGGWAALNGRTFNVTVLSSTTFSIGVDSSGFGAYAANSIRLGATSEQSNISITNNIFRGPLQSNTSFFQNRGNYLQRGITVSGNIFDNTNGTALQSTMGLNNAIQTTSGQPVINFEAIGNKFLGDYDYSAARFGNIASGVIDGNQFSPSTPGRCLRAGYIAKLTISNNRFTNCSISLQLNDGPAGDIEVKGNNINLPAANNVIGIYIEAQSQAVAATFRNNNITGAGGSFTNVYAIQDAENGGGDTSGVSYLETTITNLNTTNGLGSFKYRTLPPNALVTETPPATVPTLVSGTSQLNSATPDVRGQSVVLVGNTSSTTVTVVNNCSPGRTVTFLFTNGNTTFQNNSNIKLAGGGNFTGTADDSLTMICTNTGSLQEISRAIN